MIKIYTILCFLDLLNIPELESFFRYANNVL